MQKNYFCITSDIAQLVGIVLVVEIMRVASRVVIDWIYCWAWSE